jgi:2-C-methyl-D-erythritol 4-phosphate cytidylyltransferase
VDRNGLRLAQTPQGFHWDVLRKAHQAAQEQGAVATDDGELVERMGEPVVLVPGERRNMKVTLPEDLDLAEWVVGHPNWGTEPAAV